MKITILGAAGLRTPLLIRALATRQADLSLTELALMDIDASRLQLTAALTRLQETSGELGFKIERTANARSALDGADFVITTFRVGHMQGRVIDEHTALELGLLGQETTGPGGFAMAMRSIPVLLGYIDMMRQVCPQAWLVNFANPSGLLAEAVFTYAGWPRAAGICDAPAGMQRIAASLLGASPEAVDLDYFGLNHLGWVRAIKYQGQDMLPVFMAMLESQGGFADFPFEPVLLSGLGLVPNEYLYYYYSSRQAVANILKQGRTRGEQLLEMNEALFDELERQDRAGNAAGMQSAYESYLAGRGATYMRLETGAGEESVTDAHPARPTLPVEGSEGGYAGVALDLICALHGGRQAVLTLNVPNCGSITGMGSGDVVEIPCKVSRDAIEPGHVGEIPMHCLGLMQQVKAYEQLTAAAAVEGSLRKAVQALTLHPLVADFQLARTLVERYQARHAGYFPKLT